MTPLKLPLSNNVMVSVLQNLTKNITSLKAVGNPFMSLENFLIRNLQGLIRNIVSLKRKSLKPNLKPLSILKMLPVSNVV